MLEAMIDYLQMCPLLKGVSLSADFLGDRPGAVSVQAVACEPILYRYTDGDSLRQFVFKISSREEGQLAGGEPPEAFYGKLAAWLQSGLPTLAAEQTPQRFDILQTAAAAERDYSSTRYDMECRLVYYQKGV